MSERDTAPTHIAEGKPADPGHFVLARRHRLCTPRLAGRSGVLLDFGCGNGAQTLTFAGTFERIVGLDVNESFLAEFRASAATHGATGEFVPLPYDGERIPLEDASVDHVVSFTVLEHVPDQVLALREIFRVLKPGGRLVISVPNKWWVFETHGANLPLLPWNRVPLVSWWPKALHDRWARARIYRAREIRGLVEEAGFAVDEVFRMTAPMDVVKWPPLRDALRATIFGSDRARLPFLATEIFVVADKPTR